MKNPPARSAKYLGIFAALFFLAASQYCWADPMIMPISTFERFKLPIVIGEGLVVILEMFLLRWLLTIKWPRALGTAFLANLASAAVGIRLFDLFLDTKNIPAYLDVFLNNIFVLLFIIPLLLAILLEGLIIGVFNWRAGGKRILKASVIINCISYPLFVISFKLLGGYG